MNKGLWLTVSPIPVPLTPDWVNLFHIVVFNVGLMAAFGVFTRVSLIVFTVCYGHMVALESAWGWHDHGPSLVIQVLLVMCIAPGITMLSVDKLVKGYWKGKVSVAEICFAKIPAYGMQLILVLVVLFYTTAGVSKLRYGGLRWLDGETLSFYLAGKSKSNHVQQFGSIENPSPEQRWKDGVGLSHYLYGAKPSWFGQELSKQKTLCSLGAISSVVLELLAPIALFGGLMRRMYFVSTALFHLGIYALMGIPFLTWVLLDAVLALYPGRLLEDS
ncbi:MAG: HTTM domain-containing protein [Bdellovibrionales bacterium]|nr:HTTM domain-containing protein [Bdellovibrionales bacterium]